MAVYHTWLFTTLGYLFTTPGYLFPSSETKRAPFKLKAIQKTIFLVSQEACTGFWWGNLRERDHWGEPGVDGGMILRWIFKK
jgi:hypothetical protein